VRAGRTAQITIHECKVLDTMPRYTLEQARANRKAMRQRAYDLIAFDFLQDNNCEKGSSVCDWLQAEGNAVWWPASERVRDEKKFRSGIVLPGFAARDDIETTASVAQAGTAFTHNGGSGKVGSCEFSAKTFFRRPGLRAFADVDRATAPADGYG